MPETLEFIDVGRGADARRIAVRARDGAAPGLFWLGGFKSDMKGTKAEALARFAADKGRGFVRFDYSGPAIRRAISPTARSAAGWTKASRCSRISAAARRS
jgi:hypothetical protein